MKTRNHLARVVEAAGRGTEAAELYAAAVSVYRRVPGGGHSEVADLAEDLGRLRREARRYGEAEALLLDSYPARGRHPDREVEERTALSRLVAMNGAWGKPDEAARYQVLLSGPRPGSTR